MVKTAWPQSASGQSDDDDLFMLALEDDTEEAPWMTMGDLQFWSASSLAHSLRIYALQHDLPWYVASMLPIQYDWPGAARKKQLAPDTMVAFVPDQPHTSFDATAEGGFPPFVVEVVSPSSTVRDEQEKRRAYRLLGVQEYVLFTPRAGAASTLTGYRRDGLGRFRRWPVDGQGRLWSRLLGLYLVAVGSLVQAQTAAGEWLRTPEQEAAERQAAAEARRQADEARRQADEARRQADEARRQAEVEVSRLRRELEQYRQGSGSPASDDAE